MKLNIVIREAGFISSRIFINVYKTQWLQGFTDLKFHKNSCGFLYIHVKLVRNWCGNICERSNTGKVND